jgi:acyl-CoA thioesterase FadM
MPDPFRHHLRVRWSECDLPRREAVGPNREIHRLGTTSMTTGLAVERVPDGALLAEGKLRHVFVDPDSFEKRDIPAGVRGGLSRFARAAA